MGWILRCVNARGSPDASEIPSLVPCSHGNLYRLSMDGGCPVGWVGNPEQKKGSVLGCGFDWLPVHLPLQTIHEDRCSNILGFRNVVRGDGSEPAGSRSGSEGNSFLGIEPNRRVNWFHTLHHTRAETNEHVVIDSSFFSLGFGKLDPLKTFCHAFGTGFRVHLFCRQRIAESCSIAREVRVHRFRQACG